MTKSDVKVKLNISVAILMRDGVMTQARTTYVLFYTYQFKEKNFKQTAIVSILIYSNELNGRAKRIFFCNILHFPIPFTRTP